MALLVSIVTFLTEHHDRQGAGRDATWPLSESGHWVGREARRRGGQDSAFANTRKGHDVFPRQHGL